MASEAKVKGPNPVENEESRERSSSSERRFDTVLHRLWIESYILSSAPETARRLVALFLSRNVGIRCFDGVRRGRARK